MKTRQWILILIGAALLALTIRVFVFETIRVASPAMSESREKGDRLFVEKWTLGARLPMSLGLPFAPDTVFGKKAFLTLSDEPKRSPAFGTIRRNDLLAFNDPTAKINPDRAPILLSRCVGLPGEVFYLCKGKSIINGKVIPRHPDVSFCYSFPLSLQKTVQQVMAALKLKRPLYRDKDSGFVYLTRHEWFCLYRIRKQVHLDLKPRVSRFDEKKIRIPSKGSRIELNDSTYQLYGDLINRYEKEQLKQDTTGFILKNGHQVRFYTFKQNYYFLINDHQGYLNDSRSFGLLPEHLIIGKAWMVFVSPSGRRFLEII